MQNAYPRYSGAPDACPVCGPPMKGRPGDFRFPVNGEDIGFLRGGTLPARKVTTCLARGRRSATPRGWSGPLQGEVRALSLPTTFARSGSASLSLKRSSLACCVSGRTRSRVGRQGDTRRRQRWMSCSACSATFLVGSSTSASTLRSRATYATSRSENGLESTCSSP